MSGCIIGWTGGKECMQKRTDGWAGEWVVGEWMEQWIDW